MVQDQMGNTIRYFEYRQTEWLERAARDPISEGQRCYAYQQADVWESLARRSKEKFGDNAR